MMAPKGSTMMAPNNNLKRYHNDGTKKQFKNVPQ